MASLSYRPEAAGWSRLQPTEPMRQPLLTAVPVTRPDERPRTPRIAAARQIDHVCAPERWAPKQDDGRAERRIFLGCRSSADYKA
jgi:hypothetical protein